MFAVMNCLMGGCGEGSAEFHNERIGDKWEKLQKEQFQWRIRLLVLNLSH